MTRLYILSLLSFITITVIAQPIVHVELDLKNHKNNANNITGCVLEPDDDPYKIYIHSGVCSSTTPGVPSPADCQNFNYVWEHVVGDWGMDNGHGLMTDAGDSVWTMDIDVSTYFSNPATISQGGQSGEPPSTAMPSGATAYSMGFVFRDQDGTIGGKTGGCLDFFIFNLHLGNKTVDVEQPGQPLPDSTFSVDVATSLTEHIGISYKNSYPNPFSDQVKIVYDVIDASTQVNISIYSASGQLVKELYNGSTSPGIFSTIWDGTTESGSEVPRGIYYYTLTDGKNITTERLVKIN